MEPQQQEYNTSSLSDVGSPTLEALYNDLDMFINELSVSSSTPTSTRLVENNNYSSSQPIQQAQHQQAATTPNGRPLSKLSRGRPISKRIYSKDVTPLKLDNSMVS